MTRAAFDCGFMFELSIFATPARGMTDPRVGSGVLFGETQRWNTTERQTWINVNLLDASSLRWGDRVKLPRGFGADRKDARATQSERIACSNSLCPRMQNGCRLIACWPNVKDEPRPWPARRVRHDDLDSVASFRSLVR